MNAKDKEAKDANRDPITGAPGAHPVGTGLGAAAGGMAAGAAAGTVAGPVGMAVGAAVGAVGGLAGKAAGEAIDPTIEEAYWRKNYVQEPYYEKGRSYDDYAPAYKTGYEGRTKFSGRSFEDVERDLETNYNQDKGASKLRWENAKLAARAAWDRDRTNSGSR